MKSISIAFILITWTAVQSESPPRANYYHSTYDDIAYQEELPSLYPTQESHAHAHEHAHAHSHAHSHGGHAPAHAPAHAHAHAHAHAPAHGHGHGHGPVQHEVVVQHHHYSPQGHATRVVSHGTPETHYNPSPSHKTRGHHHSHSHAYPVKSSAYHAPKTEAVETPGLYAGYSSVKANDYKAYSMHTPASHSDDYGIEAYTPAHSADYGTPGAYHNLPTYKGAALSYAPPGDGSVGGAYTLSQSPALASYNVDHLESQYQRPNKAKGHRAPSHSHTSTHGHSSAYASAVKTPSYSKGLTTYGAPKTVQAYSSPNAYASPNAYTSPKYTTIYANKPVAYASTKPASYTVGSSLEKVKNYFRQPSKTYSAAQYGNYASAAPSYSYGSPTTKGMGYTYSQYEKPADKGYVRFADESYGGAYDAGTAHY